MKPIDPSTLFEDALERGGSTRFHLDRPFAIAPDGGVTYRIEELAGIVQDFAACFAGAGVRPGDRVAILKDNHWDFDLLAYGAIRLGAIPAKVRDDLAPGTVELLLKRLEPSLLVTTAARLEAASAAGSDLASLAPRVLTLDRPARGAVPIADVRNGATPPPHRRDDDEPLVVCLTSGTTGAPKLIVHSTTTIIRRLAQFEARRWPLLGWRPHDTVATASAFSHGRTFCWTALALQAAPGNVVIVSNHDSAHARAVLSVHPPTILEAIPSAFVRWRPMAEASEHPFRAVRLYVSTYDAVHPPVVRTFLGASQRPLPIFAQVWGQTETGPLSMRLFTRRALATRGDRHPTTRDQGRRTPGRVRLRAVDPESFRPVRRGQDGLLLARTKARGLAYLGEDERWDEKADGSWFNTGDIGRVTWTGKVIFRDREVDRARGLSCVELEDVIEDRLPEVRECIILARPVDVPVPVVVTDDGHLDRSRWRAATCDLPPMSHPQLLTWDRLPRTGTGKVRRLELREDLLAGAATCGTGRWT
jgi:acyl-coenzyme A synthetase/AMP-(fatty) acid ligase